MKRRDKMEADLLHLESEFRNLLIEALRRCASGAWGLFGGYDDYMYMPSIEGQELLGIGERIESLRRRLGYPERFGLHQRFLEYRRLRGPNDLGEPKLAVQFLTELAESEAKNV